MPAALKSINESPYGESTRHVFHVATSDLLHLLTTYGYWVSGGNILVQPSRAIREYGRLRRPERFFAGFAHVAFPAEMPHAQNLQKRCGQRLCLCLYERIASTVLDTLGSRSAGLDR